MAMEKEYEYLIGIDEVGRGPIAGPVAVGAVLVSFKNVPEVTKLCENFRDSKKLSEKKRNEWLQKINDMAKQKLLRYTVSLIDSDYIDREGIVPAITYATENCLKHFGIEPSECRVLLDRGIKVSDEYIHSESITKGDEKELLIALASIVAKVTRDKQMIQYGTKYKGYGFESHKGYGTRAHYAAVAKLGKTPIHRRSFMKEKVA